MTILLGGRPWDSGSGGGTGDLAAALEASEGSGWGCARLTELARVEAAGGTVAAGACDPFLCLPGRGPWSPGSLPASLAGCTRDTAALFFCPIVVQINKMYT